MTRKQLWATAAVVVVIVAVVPALLLLRRAHSPASDPASAAPPNVPLVAARIGDFTEHVQAQGRVGPPAGSSAKLAFAQSGILRTVDVRVGQSVAAGETLAELDRSTLGASVRSAQADAAAASPSSVQSAQARLAVAMGKLATLEQGGPSALSTRIAAQSAERQAELKVEADQANVARNEQLLAAGVVAGKDVDAARSQLASDQADQRSSEAKVAAAGTDFQSALKQARADVANARSDVQTARGQGASAQARLDAARIAFGNGILSAPGGGIVLAILKHPGEGVDPSTPVIEVGPATGHGATLMVPADTARRIAVGNSAALSIPSTGSGTVAGAVTAVVPSVDATTQVSTVVVSGVPANAISGDAVTATIAVADVRGIVVPSSAIVQDPQSGNTVVFVNNAHPKAGDSAFVLRRVIVRASDGSRAVIATGIKPGEKIAAQGGYMLLAPAGG